jgi:hypothetical protein
MNKKIITRISITIILLITIYFGIVAWKHKIYQPNLNKRDEIISRCGFSKSECEELIDQLYKQKGAKEDSINSITKKSDIEASINTSTHYNCGTCNEGKFYTAKKINEKWQIEESGMWIS